VNTSLSQLIPEVEPRVARAADNHNFPLTAGPEPFFSSVVIRMATEADQPELERLAQLDSTQAPHGPTLIGVVQGRAVVGVSLADGRSIADPFVTAAPILELVRLRARQLSATSRSAGVWPLRRQH
jgi:hypothetical protein